MNIKNLGTPYRIVDDLGNNKEVLIIDLTELTDLINFPVYNFEENYMSYLDRCRRLVSGNDFDFTKVWWHSTTLYDYDLHAVIECCLYDDYDLVIVDFQGEDSVDNYEEN